MDFGLNYFPSLFVLWFSPCLFSFCISYFVSLFYHSGILHIISYSVFILFLFKILVSASSLSTFFSVTILYSSISFLFHFSHFLVLIIFLIHFIVELLKSFCCSKYTGTCNNFVEPAPCILKVSMKWILCLNQLHLGFNRLGITFGQLTVYFSTLWRTVYDILNMNVLFSSFTFSRTPVKLQRIAKNISLLHKIIVCFLFKGIVQRGVLRI